MKTIHQSRNEIDNQDRAARLYRQGLDYYEKGDSGNAIDCFRESVRLCPDDATAWNNLGVLYHHRNEKEKALEAFEQALSLNPKYVDAWYGLGKIHILLNHKEEAVQAFRTCLRWEPRHGKSKQALEGFGWKDSFVPVRNRRIGFVTIWFERGQAYVTKQLRDVLARNHETFVFARTGGVYNQTMLETRGFWDVPNLTTHSEYRIPGDVLIRWIRDNRLNAVIFNEEYDWNLVRAAKSTGVKVMTYLDYYKEDWKSGISLYDAVLCSTFRTFYLVRDLCAAAYMGWAVDSKLFYPRTDEKKYTFFHNAGWLGINFRKMTPAVILAFDAISRIHMSSTLFIHSQVPLEKFPPFISRIVQKNSRITFHVETVPAPGLYHKGKVMVFPTKLEGLGLPLFEALACGLPVIATDAPPMNEFIQNAQNGLLVRAASNVTRQDNIAFPETIVDVNDLAEKMIRAARDPGLVSKMGRTARAYAETELSLAGLEERLQQILSTVFDSESRRILKKVS